MRGARTEYTSCNWRYRSRISFASEVKSELAGITPARDCCRLHELRGIFYANRGTLRTQGGDGPEASTVGTPATGAEAHFPSLRNPLARTVVRLARMLDLDAEIQAERHPKQLSFAVRVPLPPELARRFDDTGHAEPLQRCDRRALLRGFFLGCGSVNAPSARYHLELVPPSEAWARALADMLAAEGVRAGVTRRAGQPLLYVKDGDGVVLVLSLLGASRAVMEFENMRVVREVSAQVNRELNFETANLDKTAGSSSRQIAAIRRLEESGALAHLPPALRETARMRLLHPELNLIELARRMQISKSGINHRLRRLMEAAERE